VQRNVGQALKDEDTDLGLEGDVRGRGLVLETAFFYLN
jgi:hypothetical protein